MGLESILMRRSIVAVVLVATATLSGACASEAGGDITGKTWHLTSITTVAPNFATVVPAEAMANYTISFDPGGTFAAKADCNQVSGTYTITGKSVLTIKPGPSTLAACPDGSLSDKYVATLAQASSYTTTSNQLTITLLDNGTLSFQAG
jgi:heat shock protein HslJ